MILAMERRRFNEIMLRAFAYEQKCYGGGIPIVGLLSNDISDPHRRFLRVNLANLVFTVFN